MDKVLYFTGVGNSNVTAHSNNIIFTINDTKLFVLVVNLLAREN